MRRALLLAALMLAPLLVHTAEAGNPVAKPWSPYNAISDVNDVAIAGDGYGAAAALEAPVETPCSGLNCPAPSVPGGAPGVATSDLAIFDSDTGFVYNGTRGTGAPAGRSHVAVSHDGRAVASVGREANPVPGISTAQAFSTRLYYQRIGAGERWAPNQAAANFSANIVGNATDLVLSKDGTRLVVAVNDNGNFSVLGFEATDRLVQAFVVRQRGTVYDVAATTTLNDIAVGAQILEVNETHGVLYHLNFRGDSVKTLYERSYNGSALNAVGITPDLRLFAADARGRLLYAARSTEFASFAVPGATGNASRLAVSEDGGRLVATSQGGALAAYDVFAAPRLLWNATAGGDIVDVSLNRTGGMFLVAVNGTGGGAVAYGDDNATPLWRFGGAARAVAINSEGTLAVYAQRSAVALVVIPRTLGFEFPGGQKAATKGVAPAGTTTLQVDLRNSGAGLERVRFETPREIDVVISADEATISIPPSATRRVTFTATVGATFTGSQAFNITARSLNSGAVDNVTATLRIEAVPDVQIVLNGTDDISVVAGERTDILLGLRNNGSRDAALGLRATQQVSGGEAWNITLDPPSLTLAPNTVTTVRVSVIPPLSAANGTSNAVTFALEGPEVSDSVRITFRINPTINVEINANGRVKFVEPGKQAYYNVTVTNTGSLPRAFEAFFQATPVGGKNWAVDMDTRIFDLEPGATHTVPVRIFAPIDATPTDRVSVLVIARTIPALEFPNETSVAANLTLYANAVAPQPTTTTPGGNPLPGFEAVALVAVATLVALQARRRAP